MHGMNFHIGYLISGVTNLYFLRSQQAGRANQNGLDIDDLWSGSGRSDDKHALSGGESFIAALSIALSVSGVCNVELVI